GEPDDALGGPFALLRLDAAAEVVLAVIGAALVRPLEHDELATVFGEGVLYAVGVGALEVGGRGAGGYGERGKSEGGESEREKSVGHFGASTTAFWRYFATGCGGMQVGW